MAEFILVDDEGEVGDHHYVNHYEDRFNDMRDVLMLILLCRVIIGVTYVLYFSAIVYCYSFLSNIHKFC